MLPTLVDLGVKPGSFIRKLDNRNHWNAYADGNVSQVYQTVAEKVFNSRDEIYSLWNVNTDQELYGIIASLTANAIPKYRDIDFICIERNELDIVGINYKQVCEGKCFYVKPLHYNAEINLSTAQQLCHHLLSHKRKAQRCKKVLTISILQYQESIGCCAV